MKGHWPVAIGSLVAVLIAVLHIGSLEAGYAQDKPEKQPKEKVPLVGDSGIRPIEADSNWLSGITVSAGLSLEGLTNRTGERFNVVGPGVFFGLAQRIRGPWSAGLSLWYGKWSTIQSNKKFLSRYKEPFLSIAPLRISSHVELTPFYDPEKPFYSAKAWRYLRPSVFAGLGYVTFLKTGIWRPSRGKELTGEATIRYGVGSRFILPNIASLNVTIEQWRGVRTFEFSGYAATVSLELGDVDER